MIYNLYWAYIIIPNFEWRGIVFRDKRIKLFKKDTISYPRGFYRRIIKGYDELEGYRRFLAEECIGELFTLEEIKKVERYFQGYRGFEFGYYKEEFPIRSNIMPWGGNIVGGNCDFIMYDRRENYSDFLSFPVWGYYYIERHLLRQFCSEAKIGDNWLDPEFTNAGAIRIRKKINMTVKEIIIPRVRKRLKKKIEKRGREKGGIQRNNHAKRV